MNFGFPFGQIKFYHSAVRWLAFDDLDQNPDGWGLGLFLKTSLQDAERDAH